MWRTFWAWTGIRKRRYSRISIAFKNPKDFPDKFVVRLFDGQQPTRLVAVKDTLEEARATIPKIFYKVPRSEKDDPVIVETWL